MKVIAWAVVTVAGFGLMFGSYWYLERLAEPRPWAEAFMYIGSGKPEPSEALPPYTEARLRYLPLPEALQMMDRQFETSHARQAQQMMRSLREKVILDPSFREDFTPEMLAAGRLPRPDSDEVVAGSAATARPQIVVDGRALDIVGVFRPDVGLFADAYVLPPDSRAADLFEAGRQDVLSAFIMRRPPKESRTADLRKRLAAAFPRDRFTPVLADVRVEAGPYFLYLGGLALLLLGGSVLFVRLYAYLAGIVPWPVLRQPLQALRQWPRLLYGLHAFFFGTFLLVAAVVYFLPAVQSTLVGFIQDSIAGGHGPLGLAGKAYLSGSIPLAALATLGVNFILGTVLVISLPSVVVPGCGCLVMLIRSVMVATVLAPSTVHMAGTMVPHSLTILVELEAYIVATFFALMVPVYLFRTREGPTIPGRYGRTVILNLQGLLLVLVILAVVALYEAAEVILQLP